MKRARLHLTLILGGCLCLLGRPALAAPWLIFTEVQAEPLPDGPGEYVELWHAEPPRVDLGGWRLEGEIEFEFPRGFTLLPGEVVVIAARPGDLARAHPGAPRILGPFTGKLDNDGGSVRLVNPAGATVARLRYDLGGEWPSVPSGTGHSLQLRNPYLDATDPSAWEASPEIGGTPGQVPVNLGEREKPGELLIRSGDTWRYRTTLDRISPGWRERDFDDTSWEQGRSGFGYGDGDDRTSLSGLRNRALTACTRRRFTVPDDREGHLLVLDVDYDDGFAAFINGVEVARANLGPAGTELSLDREADGYHEAGRPEHFVLGRVRDLLVPGENTLAVEVHNHELSSTDMSLIVELRLLEAPDSSALSAPPSTPRINEVATGEESWVELYQAGPEPLEVGEHWLSADPARTRGFQIPAGTSIPAQGWLRLGRAELGDNFRLSDESRRWILSDPEGRRVLDLLDGRELAGPSGEEELASLTTGRFPDGEANVLILDEPTPGERNRTRPPPSVVISEILYAPPGDDERQTFIELHNAGTRPVDLEGLRLAGGVAFTFPPDSRLEAGERRVVASSPAYLARLHQLPVEKVFGPLEQRLSGRGERIDLVDARGRIVDRVHYADRFPWPVEADRGSSLELIHPGLDRRLAGSWAPSREDLHSSWIDIRYTLEHDHRGIGDPSLFQLFLLGEGTCLVDDFSIEDASGAVLLEEDFESGATSWSACGTHEESAVETDPARPGNRCYRIVARGRGNSRNNSVYFSLRAPPIERREYTVRFRARWIEGSLLLLSRTSGQGLARLNQLERPDRAGTPGAVNSRHRETPFPVVGQPTQFPVAPSSTDPVTITARVSSVAPVERVEVHYRADRWQEAWQVVPLAETRPGSGIFGGLIPAGAGDRVEYLVRAFDAAGQEGTYPPGAPDRTMLYSTGIRPHSRLPTYTILVSEASRARLEMRPTLSNFPVDATLVFGDTEIFHNVQLRRRGSPFTRPRPNWRVDFGARTLDGRRSLTLDAQNGEGNQLSERLTYWLVDQLHAPNSRQRFVEVRMPGLSSGRFEDVEKVDSDYLERWFAPRTETVAVHRPADLRAELRPLLHKIDDHWELSPPGAESRHRSSRHRSYREAYFRYRGPDPEDYRWNFPARLSEEREDFEPLIELIRTLDPSRTPDPKFDEKFEQIAGVDVWLRVLAARTFAHDWDSIGLQRGKNAYLYRNEHDGLWYLLPWDADLSWQRSTRSRLISRKFPAVARLLTRPRFQRRFLGYLATLCERSLDPARIGVVLDDLEKHIGDSTSGYEWFARERRDYVQRQLPRARLRLEEVRRVTGVGDERDRLLLEGEAPLLAMRARLGGHEADLDFPGLDRFRVLLPLGPAGGSLTVGFLDLEGEELARVPVEVPDRPGAPALEARPERPPVEFYASGEKSEIVPRSVLTSGPEAHRSTTEARAERAPRERVRRGNGRTARPDETRTLGLIRLGFQFLVGFTILSAVLGLAQVIYLILRYRRRRATTRRPPRRPRGPRSPD